LFVELPPGGDCTPPRQSRTWTGFFPSVLRPSPFPPLGFAGFSFFLFRLQGKLLFFDREGGPSVFSGKVWR